MIKPMVVDLEVDATSSDGFYYYCFFYSHKKKKKKRFTKDIIIFGFTKSYLQFFGKKL